MSFPRHSRQNRCVIDRHLKWAVSSRDFFDSLDKTFFNSSFVRVKEEESEKNWVLDLTVSIHKMKNKHIFFTESCMSQFFFILESSYHPIINNN